MARNNLLHNEYVHFRMFHMPCCGHNLCWVNPRLPSHCTECGTLIYWRLKSQPEHTLMDSPALLKVGESPT